MNDTRTGDNIGNTGVISASQYTIVCGKPWKFCPECGNKLGDGWKFCSGCGMAVMHSSPPMQVWPYPIYPRCPEPYIITWGPTYQGSTTQ